jgi:hypothetical protein
MPRASRRSLALGADASEGGGVEDGDVAGASVVVVVVVVVVGAGSGCGWRTWGGRGEQGEEELVCEVDSGA